MLYKIYEYYISEFCWLYVYMISYGVPIFRGKPRRIHFQALVDKAKARLSNWKGELLLMAR